MKKINVLLLFCLLVTGCNASKNETSKQEKYKNYVDMLIDNKDDVTGNIPFEYELDMNQINDEKYEYSLAIKNPKVAMYNIRMLAADLSAISEKDLAPTLGIVEVEDERYNMIPNQINQDKNYYGGVVLTSTSLKSKFRIHAFVSYLDKNQNENYVYFHVDADYNDFKKEEPKDEKPKDEKPKDEKPKGDKK